MPEVIYANGLSKKVKNLGWLIEHFPEVCSIQVTEPKKQSYEAFLLVDLTEYRTYIVHFGSKAVLWNWLMNKQWIQGVPLEWFGQKMVINRKNKMEDYNG